MSRDFSKPYTQEELEGLKTMFRDLPTYKPGGWVKASDIPAIIQGMGYTRTPEQVGAYQAHWEDHYGGVVTLEAFLESASVLHDTAEYAKDYALRFDKNGDGQISAEEFKALINVISKHDPKLEGITFEHFVEEADLDHDGQVSIHECAEWIRAKCEAAQT